MKISELASDSFSCCHMWEKCNMGYSDCYFKVSDPLMMEKCKAFQLHNGKTITLSQNSSKVSPEDFQMDPNSTDGQLSLF